MSHSKLMIEFHPRRLSHSGSRQKFSPYRSKQRRIQNQVISQKNKQKLEINEPLINFRRLIDPNASKKRLKINAASQKVSREVHCHAKSSQKIKDITSHQICMNCVKLMSKIEELTTLLNENLKEINKSIKMPRLQDKEEDYNKQLSPNQHVKNQRIIIHYLEELRQRSDQISHFENQRNAYEEQLTTMKSTIQEWQMRYQDLEMKLAFCNTNNSQQNSAEQFPSNKTCIDASTSSKFIFRDQSCSELMEEQFDFPKESNSGRMSNASMKFILEDIMKRQGSDFQKIMGELQQIKLENEMLREEVNLLNYALEEKDSKIEKLKTELFSFMRIAQQKPSLSKSIQSSAKTNQKKKGQTNSLRRSMGISIEWNIEDGRNGNQAMANKKTESFIISSRSNIFLDTLIKPNLSESDISSDQMEKIEKMIKTSPLSSSREKIMKNKMNHKVSEDKFIMAKSLLKLKKQDSIITKYEKQQLEKEKKQLQCFSENRMQDLDLIRRTLMYRFKGFKWSYQNFQTLILQREDPNISYSQMKDILAQYPFSLEKRLKKRALEYILRQSEVSSLQSIEIPCDLFCNRLRQLIPDVEYLEEEQQSGLIETLKKKIYMFQQGIENQCSQVSDRRGCITQSHLRSILGQFKLSELEKGTIISQCCLLSSDADRLNYKHYFSIYRNDE